MMRNEEDIIYRLSELKCETELLVWYGPIVGRASARRIWHEKLH